VYQSRIKSFPVAGDEHFHFVCRYAERNPPWAKLVQRAEAWRWCSFYQRKQSATRVAPWLSVWPLEHARRWLALLNAPDMEAELEALRRSVRRRCPCGELSWSDQTVRRPSLEMTVRPHGRP
jgi:putative transposase